MLEQSDRFEFDPYDRDSLVERLGDLIDIALDYPDVLGSKNKRFSVIHDTPVWLKDEDTLIEALAVGSEYINGAVVTRTQVEPRTQIEVGVDILSRKENQIKLRNSVVFTDLTNTKIGTRLPVIEELSLEDENEVKYVAGYQWEEERDGKTEIQTAYQTLPVDDAVLRRFVAVLDRAYTTVDPYFRRDAFGGKIKEDHLELFDPYFDININ